ncbi:MAG: aldehyde dehydrogenase family protein [Granulosicoccus sp.]|nr:aldehyde dehydrogenase family protein [Granulosicoccus sp.]
MTNKIQCISPIDGSVYVERPVLTDLEAKAAIAGAKKAQKSWAATPLKERIRLVQAGVEKIGEWNDAIVEELAWQMGRPIRYGGEYGGFKERADYMASIAETALSRIEIESSDQFRRFIQRDPRGVVFVVAPWNYPYMTAINTVAPALIAGNAVILKHASQTPLVGERMAAAFQEVGIPAEVMQNVFISHQQTNALIAAGSFDFVNFTGSVAGGKAMEHAAAGTFTPVSTELGGKDPGYVAEDADIEAAVDTLIDGAMFNSGQCCCGIERIYVAQPLFNDFIERAVSIVNKYKLGNPLESDTTLGPMAHKRFAEHVRKQTAAAVSAGARPLIEASSFDDDGGAYLMPQILVNVDHGMDIMNEESFGPVVGIMPVSGDEEALAQINDSRFGLTASIWTSDPARAQKMGDQIETGTVFMNRCDYLDPALCWTGCKDTGSGGGLSIIGYHNLTRPKSFHLKMA